MTLISDSVLAETAEGPRLVGARSHETGEIVFPAPEGAEAARYDRLHLSDVGTLWSYTVQRFPPKSPPYGGVTDPARFEPFALGYVELQGEVIVETRIAVDDFSVLKIGLPMKLTTLAIPRGDADGVLQTYAFTPA